MCCWIFMSAYPAQTKSTYDLRKHTLKEDLHNSCWVGEHSKNDLGLL